jgi:hypothetical protein
VLHKKVLGLAAVVAATITIAACSEQLEGGAACPLLCPTQPITLLDTTIDAVVIDTTVLGLPPIGSEAFMMLASHGDTLDARAIIRFDTLPTTYTKSGIDSTIVNIDTAQLVTPIVKPDTAHRPTAPITIEAYNVDTTGTDTVAAVLASLFRPSRLIGSKTFAPESLTDTLRIPISTDTVLDRVRSGTKLRVGLRLVSSEGFNLQIGTVQSGTPVQLRIVASKDTAATPVLVSPLSTTPTDASFLAGQLSDYTIVVRGANSTSAGLLGVGGVPSRRVYFKLSIPSHIVDSTSIVRASLELTQTPNRRLNPRDSIFVFPSPIVASPTVTDIKTALQFLGGAADLGLDSLKLAPGDSGVRSFQIVELVRRWRLADTTLTPRTLALRAGTEGQAPQEINFFSSRAGDAVRPRLRLTYAPQTQSGLP